MNLELRGPFPVQSWPRVWTWIQPFKARILDDFAPQTVDEYVAVMIERTRGQMTFAVVRDGELGGLIWFEAGSGINGVLHVVFKPSFWGGATTGPMIAAAVERFFASGPVKLNYIRFSDNRAIHSVVKRFGFRREGVIRDATRRGGELAALECWGVTAEAFAQRRDQ